MNLAKQTIPYAEVRYAVGFGCVGWLPLILLPTIAIVFGLSLPPWEFMWAIAFALFFGCKWLTWWQNKNIGTTIARHLCYLFAWPGMDAKVFLNPAIKTARPRWTDWAGVVFKMGFGGAIFWGVARQMFVSEPILRGWAGLVGLILMLHFGTFHLLALIYQTFGINAKPLMRAPTRATSLTEFWGLRWNSAFNRLVHDLVFRPLHRAVGTATATMLVFLVSGIVHDLVISLPARGGYGLPTIYFMIQGGGLLFERSRWGRRFGLREGIRGWLFTMLITAGPVFW